MVGGVKSGSGAPAPLGATVTTDGVNFALRSPSSTAASIVVLDLDGAERCSLELPRPAHRTGNVWHVELIGLEPPCGYGWRLDGPSGNPDRFDPARLLLDPYGRAVGGSERWGCRPDRRFSIVSRPLASTSSRPRLAVEPAERVIYELSVRGFSRHPSSAGSATGTFAGLEERLPYLRSLGVTTVELLPIAEWDELEVTFESPAGRPLRNLWGYSPLSFFAPKAGLAACDRADEVAAELRRLVDALHDAGLEVLLDVVFNHTGERRVRAMDPAAAFQGVDRPGFYRLDVDGDSVDVTGCGNSVRTSHAPVADLLVEALRWWHRDVGVDGFRFDLAAALARGEDGEHDPSAPLLRRIGSDAELAPAVLIAEPWDGAGLYLPGRIAADGRWAEWNDQFRDTVRRFVRGDAGETRALADALSGSPGRFSESGSPLASINFVTCHDGLTLADLVTFEQRHNLANGEGNRDGSTWNHAWNCGVEGPTDNPTVWSLRRRQVRNLLTLLLVARGVPMLLAGDEIGNGQGGNNNAYCQDDETGWVDWSDPDEDLRRFVAELIAFRRAHPSLRRDRFLPPPEDETGCWRGQSETPDWSPDARVLALHWPMGSDPPDDDLFLAINGSDRLVEVEVPTPRTGAGWRQVVDTAAASPGDIFPSGHEPPIDGRLLVVGPRSVALLRAPRA